MYDMQNYAAVPRRACIHGSWTNVQWFRGGFAFKAHGLFPCRTRSVVRRLPAGWVRVLDGSAGSEELLLMEPLVDFLNHQTTAASETTYGQVLLVHFS